MRSLTADLVLYPWIKCHLFGGSGAIFVHGISSHELEKSSCHMASLCLLWLHDHHILRSWHRKLDEKTSKKMGSCRGFQRSSRIAQDDQGFNKHDLKKIECWKSWENQTQNQIMTRQINVGHDLHFRHHHRIRCHLSCSHSSQGSVINVCKCARAELPRSIALCVKWEAFSHEFCYKMLLYLKAVFWINFGFNQWWSVFNSATLQ